MFGDSKEIARFNEGNLLVSVHQDNRRIDEEDEWVQFHAEVTHPSGRLVLGEGLLGSLPYLLYEAKRKVAEQREKIETEDYVPA